MMKRNNFKKRVVNNVKMNVKLDKANKNAKRPYEHESLIELLSMDVFGKFSIPLYASKKSLFGEEGKKGTVAVGYINGFNAETETFEVTVKENFGEVISTFEDAVIIPNVFVKDGKAVTVLSLNICPNFA